MIFTNIIFFGGGGVTWLHKKVWSRYLLFIANEEKNIIS